jgi:hypothetical protein
LEDLDIDGRIIMHCILNKSVGSTLGGLNWLWLWTRAFVDMAMNLWVP